ncbi:type II toxin-antitoxin system HicB family antitoxin [Haloarcula sp. AONF1]
MSSRADRSSTEETITVFESDGKIVARDESTGVSSFGESKTQALERLSEALELYEQPVPEDDEPDGGATAPWL